MLFGKFGQRCQNSVIPVKKLMFSKFGPENAKIWQVLSKPAQGTFD